MPKLTFGHGHLLRPLRSFAVFLFFVSLFGLSVCFLAALSPLRGIRYGVGDSDEVSRQSPLGLLLERAFSLKALFDYRDSLKALTCNLITAFVKDLTRSQSDYSC